jgi:hypothetical protein
MYCVDSILKVYSRIHMTEILYSRIHQEYKNPKFFQRIHIFYSGIQPRIHQEYIENTSKTHVKANTVSILQFVFDVYLMYSLCILGCIPKYMMYSGIKNMYSLEKFWIFVILNTLSK